MRKLLLTFLAALTVVNLNAATYQLQLSPDDTFKISDTDDWKFTVTRLQVMEVAEVKLTTNESLLMLYFMRDSGNYGQFNTPGKMEGAIRESGQKHVKSSVEQTVNIEKFDVKGTYGFKACLTAKQKEKVPAGQYLYLILGMVRLSDDTALGFRLCTNDPNSAETKKLERYILSFIKNVRP